MDSTNNATIQCFVARIQVECGLRNGIMNLTVGESTTVTA
jgi:hypothetical protein